MKQEPCGFLGDAEGARNLARTDAVLGADNDPDSGKPLVPAKCGILKDGSNLRSELPLCVCALALPFFLGGEIAHISASASGTYKTVRPAVGNDVAKAVIGIGKINNGLLKGERRFHGAVLGKLIELSGFAKSIVLTVIQLVGNKRTVLSIVLASALLAYGGGSPFVVVFAVYPFAVEMFKHANLPKRLIHALLSGGFTMDAVPGTLQIKNIIPTTFLHTTALAAPWLVSIGVLFIFLVGIGYLHWQMAGMNTASEYCFGAVISALPGFQAVRGAVTGIP